MVLADRDDLPESFVLSGTKDGFDGDVLAYA